MDFIQVAFTIDPAEEYICDILAADLGSINFDSFVFTETGMEAYISSAQFDEEKLKELLSDFAFDAAIQYQVTSIETKNWNEEWEKHYFEPIVIGSECVIHSSFHKNIPDAKYDIVIDPKMSFGTGHHETTSLMIGELLQIELEGKTVLDMGCGAGVIGASLCTQRPELEVEMCDINALALESARRTLAANGLEARIYPSDMLSDVPGQVQHIVTNPPFHTGLKTLYGPSEQLILGAPQKLAPHGSLLLVANAFLKYQPFLQEAFKQSQTIAATTKFKLYHSF